MISSISSNSNIAENVATVNLPGLCRAQIALNHRLILGAASEQTCASVQSRELWLPAAGG